MPSNQTPSEIAASRLRACAAWNDEAGANAWAASQKQTSDEAREAGERECSRLWAQGKRLHAQADALLSADLVEAA